MEELLFIKKYMLYNNYKSVLFVSHPQHSRRISVLANFIANYKENDLQFSIVSCDLEWWDKSNYYKNKTSLITTFGLKTDILVLTIITIVLLSISTRFFSKIQA